MQVEKLFCYPIKGLGAEVLDSTHVEAGRGIALDRHYAITHGNSKFSTESPAWVPRRNFVTVARSPQLCTLHIARTGQGQGKDQRKSEEVLRVSTAPAGDTGTLLFETDPAHPAVQALDNPKLAALLEPTQPGPYSLIRTTGYSLWDASFASISIMNLATLQDLAEFTSISPDPHRFRGNLWISGVPAWEELNWVGSTLTLTDNSSTPPLTLRIVEPIERCRAINTHPDTGKLDIPVTRHIMETCGHCDFGVHAEVLTGGDIHIGDQLSLQQAASDHKETFKPPFS